MWTAAFSGLSATERNESPAERMGAGLAFLSWNCTIFAAPTLRLDHHAAAEVDATCGITVNRSQNCDS